jgi:hypothetical protein
MPATDPATLAADMTADLRSALRPSMESLGRDMQSDMRDLISVPVQYVAHGSGRPAKPKRIGNKPGPGLRSRPGLGHAVVRSKRGEPPRKEFGLLYKSMTTDTVNEGDGLTARMGSDTSIADYAERLEERMQRPHFATIFERVKNYAVDRILSRLPSTI